MVSTSDRITSPDHTNPRRRPTPEAYEHQGVGGVHPISAIVPTWTLVDTKQVRWPLLIAQPRPITLNREGGPRRRLTAQGRRSRSGTGRARRSRRRRRRDTRSSPLPSLRPRRRSSTRTRRSRFGPGGVVPREPVGHALALADRPKAIAPWAFCARAGAARSSAAANVAAGKYIGVWRRPNMGSPQPFGNWRTWISVIHNLKAWQCEVPRLPGTVGTASAAPLPGRFGAAERGRVCSARERLAGDSRENGSRQRRGRPDGGTLCAWCADSYTSRGKIPTVMDGAELSC